MVPDAKGVQSSAGGATTAAENELRWGPIVFHPRFFYRMSYGDQLQAAPGVQEESFLHEISAAMTFDLGEHWRLDYAPSMLYYSSDEFEDTLNHTIGLSGSTTYQDWAFGLAQSCFLGSNLRTETGGQTEEENYATSLTASRLLGSQMSLDMSLHQSLRFVGEGNSTLALTDSKDWSTVNWLNYQLAQHLGLAVGFTFGYVDVRVGSDMTYEQIQGRINWQAGEKLSLLLTGGADLRQFIDSDISDLLNPLFGLTIEYKVLEQTTLSVNANHAVNASYFANQVTENTSVGAGLRQRLFGKLNVDISGGYGFSSYTSTASGLSVDRQDDSFYYGARLGTTFLKRGTISVFYYASENTSNESGFSYSNNQIGVEIGYRY